jgi:hypothetical protein
MDIATLIRLSNHVHATIVKRELRTFEISNSEISKEQFEVTRVCLRWESLAHGVFYIAENLKTENPEPPHAGSHRLPRTDI